MQKVDLLASDTMSYETSAKLLDECHSNVKIEPALTPLSGESFDYATTILTDEARVDIAARGVWVKGQMALFDVRVFTPLPKLT